MEEQKKNVIEFVRLQKSQGQSITESLKELGVRRSTYYTWLNPKQKKHAPSRVKLTPCEQQAIEATKEHYPHLRHRQIQGML